MQTFKLGDKVKVVNEPGVLFQHPMLFGLGKDIEFEIVAIRNTVHPCCSNHRQEVIVNFQSRFTEIWDSIGWISCYWFDKEVTERHICTIPHRSIQYDVDFNF